MSEEERAAREALAGAGVAVDGEWRIRPTPYPGRAEINIPLHAAAGVDRERVVMRRYVAGDRRTILIGWSTTARIAYYESVKTDAD